MNRKNTILAIPGIFLVGLLVLAFVPSNINDFFLPGSQSGQSGNLEHPGKCDNCHGGYDLAVEPAFNWRGSMMAQAQRDPLYLACLAISNQDVPESGDLCIRCHAPDGWLNGRSEPTDGSALNNNDREGVQCDFCHKLVKPTPLGVNPYPGDPDYTAGTYERDQAYLSTLEIIPPASANGMYIADSKNSKRGPFVDANAKHQMLYSPFHQDAAICGTCHDVSNPAFNGSNNEYLLNDFGAPSPSFDPYNMFPVERTYSEWLNSAYNSPEGIYAPQLGGNKQYVSTCQDCHMRDVSGYGCNKKGIPFRDDLPLHDMTGGNTFIPDLVEQLFPDEVNQAALSAGVQRATYMLQNAASLDLSLTDDGSGGYLATVKVTNETGHKLPSGYPEGRRIWINLKAWQGESLVFESGAYNMTTAELNTEGAKIYEIKPGISDQVSAATGLSAGPSFHFVLNSKIYSDNRIPPRGFTNEAFEAIQSPPINYSYLDGQYWDNTEYTLPGGIDRVEAVLFYQTLSLEYVTFLRDENVTNDAGNVLYDLWAVNGKSAPVEMNTALVNLAPPVAAFSADPESGYAPLSVVFSNQSSNGPTSYNWSFGDGATSTEENPVHIFNMLGEYTVSLTVENEFGSDITTGIISVSEMTLTPMYASGASAIRVASKGGRYYAEATVSIEESPGVPVGNAEVTVSYTGSTSGTRTGSTDVNGLVVLETRAAKNPSENWCFDVTSVNKTDYLYIPENNIISGACESGLKSELLSGVSDLLGSASVMNFPNPFSKMTHIQFNLNQTADVKLEVFSAHGQKIAVLVDSKLSPGDHVISWKPGNIPDGVYFYRISAGKTMITKRMTLRK